MNRFLQCFNLAGVAALGVLCVLQWRNNRTCSLDQIALQKEGRAQSVKLVEQSKKIDGLTADLESFRQQVSRAGANWKEAEGKLRASERESASLATERDQLKTNVTAWADAVAARDAKIKEANESLQKLAAERDGLVGKYNQLADKHNAVIKDLDETLAQLAAARTNNLTTKKN